jgi:hypothetical protein
VIYIHWRFWTSGLPFWHLTKSGVDNLHSVMEKFYPKIKPARIKARFKLQEPARRSA